jgi:hypothetical protein
VSEVATAPRDLEGERLLPSGPIPPELYAFGERLAPDSPPEEIARWAQTFLDKWRAPLHWPPDRRYWSAETAVTCYWRDPTTESALAWLDAVLPTISEVRRHTRMARKKRPTRWELREPKRFGPYLADSYLGQGGDGMALHARHTLTGQEVTIKKPARGDAGALRVLGDDWHPSIIRIYEDGVSESGEYWAAREYTPDGTLEDLLRKRGFQPLPIGEGLAILSVCCKAVAWLHSRHVYRWSSHARNVLRFGYTWKVSDLGRCLFFLPPDHPLIEKEIAAHIDAAGAAEDDTTRALTMWLLEDGYWRHSTAAGVLPYNLQRERRLSINDCSMLVGLLVDVLAPGHRWDLFYQALKSWPLCSATYTITGHKQRDRALSGILNRAWRGDEGGAPLLANRGRGEQTTYTDPLELLHVVEALF